MSNLEKNKRIAKNVLMLYIRLFFLMGISFYMSRAVLKILGVEDFGVYNVVGGIVTMMSFMNSSLNITTQRFLNYEMGKGNLDQLNKVFIMSFWSYALIAIVVFLISETVGLWFLYEHLNIPPNRMSAAVWVFQFSIITFIVNLFTVPYNSTIIAHEKMNFYAYVSIGDSLLKLLLVFALQYINYDKLWLYGFLMLIATSFIWGCNWWFCRINFSETKLRFVWDASLFKKLLAFSGWNSVGAISSSINDQGVNILINIFFSPVLNAARAIAYQVRLAVNSFSANFLTAVRPQIFKSYAEGNIEYMNKLMFSSSKLSVYLLLPFILPILLNTEYILSLWLGSESVTGYMITFTQLALIAIPVNSCFPVLALASQATGRISKYQITASFFLIMIPVSSYILFRYGLRAEWAFVMLIVWDFLGLFGRLAILKREMNFPIIEYVKNVIYPIAKTMFVTLVIIGYPLYLLDMNKLQYLLISTISTLIVLFVTIWCVGLERTERDLIRSYVKKIIRHAN